MRRRSLRFGHLTQKMMAEVLFLTAAGQSLALDEINTTFFGSLTIEGFDPVSFFTEQRAVDGSRDFELNCKGANWRFSSAANLSAFRGDPECYAPKYGGYCAPAVSQIDTSAIDPTQFNVYNGKLYLNYNKKIGTRWQADKDGFIVDADRYWPRLLSD